MRSHQEAIASTMIRDIASYSYAGIVSGRRTEEEQSGTAYAPNVYLPCKDGMVVIVTASEDGWKKLVEVMGYPKWCSHEDFRDTASRAKNISSLLTNLVDWTKSKTGAEITRLTQSNGLPCAHVLRISEVVESDHARERAAFVELQIGGRMCRMPGRHSGYPISSGVQCSAPRRERTTFRLPDTQLGVRLQTVLARDLSIGYQIVTFLTPFPTTRGNSIKGCKRLWQASDRRFDK